MSYFQSRSTQARTWNLSVVSINATTEICCWLWALWSKYIIAVSVALITRIANRKNIYSVYLEAVRFWILVYTVVMYWGELLGRNSHNCYLNKYKIVDHWNVSEQFLMFFSRYTINLRKVWERSTQVCSRFQSWSKYHLPKK